MSSCKAKENFSLGAAFTAVALTSGILIYAQSRETENATEALAEQGYSNVSVGNWQRSKASCDLLALYGAPFTATQKDGKQVQGSYCRSLSGKSTLKFRN